MESKKCIITGANAGIGKEAAMQIAEKGFHVIMACRSQKRGEDALNDIIKAVWLAEELKQTDITVNCLRVTAVKVDLSRHPELSPFMKRIYSIKARKALSPRNMAETYTDLAYTKEYTNATGKYFDEKSRVIKYPEYCSKTENIMAVMELTKTYIPELGGL